MPLYSDLNFFYNKNSLFKKSIDYRHKQQEEKDITMSDDKIKTDPKNDEFDVVESKMISVTNPR